VTTIEIPDEGLPVKLPSGAEWRVLTPGEVKYTRERVKLYTQTFKFSNVSDLADLDRVVALETLTHRMSLFVSLERDYENGPVGDIPGLRRQLGDLSNELRQLKKSLRLDKASRAQDDQADVIMYLEQLRQRAKAFGIHRDEQLAVGLELVNQLIALVQLHLNATEQERKEMRCTQQDIVDWVWNDLRPKFEAVDERFRKTNQRMWWVTGEGL
jgi:hypothetical protein